MMHKSSKSINRELLSTYIEPERTSTYTPIRHDEVINMTEDTLGLLNYKMSDTHCIVNNQGKTSKEGDRMITSFTVKSDRLPENDDYAFKMAVVNSYDKSYSLKYLMGLQVFVCTNGMWDATENINCKHTINIVDKARTKLRDIVMDLQTIHKNTINGYEDMKEMDFSCDKEVSDFVVRSCKKKIIGSQDILPILEHWENPEHHEFKDRNGCSLFNAYTSHLRKNNPFTLSDKTKALRSYIDVYKKPDTNNGTTTDVRHNEFESTRREVRTSIW
tara:strand:- start:77 stop:898 length:822 start_codon:yes stop_codon:yes gene_type:complete